MSKVGDPLWWHCGSPFGACEGGVHDSAIVEHAYNFLGWLMSRPENSIAVATHSIFLLAIFHGALAPAAGKKGYPVPQLFHTGELRTVLVTETVAPEGAGACLTRWGDLLTCTGLPQKE